MKFLLIPDKFKGSATSEQVIGAIRKGILSVFPNAEIHSIVASDGGDGFLRSVEVNRNTERIDLDSVDAMGNPIESYYLLDRNHDTAYIELANCSGLAMLDRKTLNILQTSTFGTGLQIVDAIEKGAQGIYIGIGGSATNDAGMGIMHALGYAFLDMSGNELVPYSGNLNEIHTIKKPDKDKSVELFAVNDVANPLCGPSGAAYVYARQKGATDDQVEFLDESLKHISGIVEKVAHRDDSQLAGAGAAGGTAYGLKSLLGAEFINGFHFLAEQAGLDRLLRENKFDYLITGEGQFDHQSLQGKLVGGLLDLARQHKTRLIVVCGKCTFSNKELSRTGVDVVLPLVRNGKTTEETMRLAEVFIGEEIRQYLVEHRMFPD